MRRSKEYSAHHGNRRRHRLANDLKSRRTKVRHPQTNGFVERLQRIVKDEFFAVALREFLYDSVDGLQTDLEQWLLHYNIGSLFSRRAKHKC